MRAVRPPTLFAVLCWVLGGGGCPVVADDDDLTGDDDTTAADDDSAGDDDTTEPPVEPLYAVAVFADPHVSSSGVNEQRLGSAVDWVEANAAGEGIELVLVLGDIAWNDGLGPAREQLDALSVPWVPIIGDNEVQSDDEQAYHDAFDSHFESLPAVLDGFRRADAPVWNPEAEMDSWFQNSAFEVQGLHFVGVDWSARGIGGILGEAGQLNDIEGGTFPWFVDELSELEEAPLESVILFSHIPMHLGAFNLEQMEALTGVTDPVGDRVYANLAGHIHVNAEVEVEDGGYTVFVTDAIWDDELTIRLLRVAGNGARFEFEHELIVLP